MHDDYEPEDVCAVNPFLHEDSKSNRIIERDSEINNLNSDMLEMPLDVIFVLCFH